MTNTQETLSDRLVPGTYNGAIGGEELHPPEQETNQPSKYKITIEPLDYGYLVSVGCQKLAVESSEKLVKKLGDYLANPGSIQSTWFSTDKAFMTEK